MSSLKTHIALNVTDLNRSIAFYQSLLNAKPVKHKPGYAKFDLDNPGLNLTLNVRDTATAAAGVSHFGIQVESPTAVQAAITRFQAAGLATFEEHNTHCCYALQDKVWVTDPDHNRWEIFVLKVADTSPDTHLSA